MKRILCVFGTRPETIKIVERRIVCGTGDGLNEGVVKGRTTHSFSDDRLFAAEMQES